MVWNVLAICVAAAALLASIVVAAQQASLMFRANHIPVFIELLSQFRSLEFNDNCNYIIDRLGKECVPEETGISGLPDAARAAVYDASGFFVEVAMLRLVGGLDYRFDSFIQIRTPRVWKALSPFVMEERKRLGVTSMFWRSFEELAADLERLPEGSINILIDDHRRQASARFPRLRGFVTPGRQIFRLPDPVLPQTAVAAPDGADIPAPPGT
jgi:hypothetical protein